MHKKMIFVCTYALCLSSINILFLMIAKAEEDAIVIDDDGMEAEEPLTGAETHKPPGKTHFDVQLAICKEDNLDEDPEAVINRRLTKFFEYGKKIEPGREYFCSRKEPNNAEDVALIENQLIIFGLDFKKLKKVKEEYQTNEAVRINPSNFKLIYPSRGAAWNALKKNIKDPSILVTKAEQEDGPMIKSKCCNFLFILVWFEMAPYSYNNHLISVWARFATQEEKDLHPKQE